MKYRTYVRFPIGLRKHFRTCENDDCGDCYEFRRVCKKNNWELHK